MNKIENLKDLLIEEGREIYDANLQGLRELKNIEAQVTELDLKNLIKKQVGLIEDQQKVINDAFRKLHATCEGGKCPVTKSILSRLQNVINKSKETSVRDAGIISSLQLLNHRKIGGLGVAASYARELGMEESARLFHKALVEEKQMDKELSTIAQLGINKKAVPSKIKA